MENIRNFCIIAHIDHGKSTLADRLLEFTGTVEKRDMQAQLLDSMDLEREKGITIKLAPVRMHYTLTGQKYILNLIDTPGHVDFQYEVSRSLAAVEGALLVVDAAQGIQAQTLANAYQAQDIGLKLIPVINKIDLPGAEPERVAHELIKTFGFDMSEMIFVSAKTGQNIDGLLAAVIERIPAPKGDPNGNLQALIFDSLYDSYRGVIAYVRVVTGSLVANQKLYMLAADKSTESLEVGYFSPRMSKSDGIKTGEIGYIVTSLKDVSLASVGDTVMLEKEKTTTPGLPGYKKAKPTVFAGLYPTDGTDYARLRDGLSKLKMNDASLITTNEKSPALGLGFRCGFLGMLHLDIIKERLERENDLDLIVTSPTVEYDIELSDGTMFSTSNPADFPDPSRITAVAEPWVLAEILVPKDFVGPVMEMLSRYRGIYKDMSYLDETKTLIKFEIPLAAMIMDFYDDLKSVSSGYASLNYEHLGMREGDLVKMDILLAGDIIETLAKIVEKEEAEEVGRAMVAKLKELLPRQMFEVSIQAAIGSRILARESMSAMRKDVTGYLYGGDRSRKDKLLKKQKAGKKKMKMFGKVNIPSNVFLDLLKK
ncbi:MAG: translation elongation factor 4 [Patescibacteria group bacterium]